MRIKAPTSDDEDIAIRLEKVKARMRTAIRHSSLAAPHPTLVAVSKTVEQHPIETLLRCGHISFGENRVQEASRKWPGLKAKYPGAKLHLIGQLQTNKVKEAAQLFDVIETVDRTKLAEELATFRDRNGFCPALLVQVNTGCEPQKGGIAPAEADNLLQFCVSKLGLPVRGLCIHGWNTH